ncbi:protein kinase [candidate division KSB1 bacterium]|nr:protein kinase [candidate division KSB1 bacterium]
MLGKMISHYKILEKLGEGGMGIVYKAHDTKLNRMVALKFLPPAMTSDPEAKERFIQEAQTASALDHPNICTIHEIDETDDGQTFIVMAFYDGETLKKKIEQEILDKNTAIDITIQIAKGLKEAHDNKIVHRDIKPANIMVTTKNQVKIMDFGLAKLAGRAHITTTGSTVGTAAYMSPEQASGKDVDFRSDIWSLGTILYEMLTRQRPFKGDYEQAVVYSILNEEPAPVTSLNTELPEYMQKIIHKTLSKDPDKRYQSVSVLIEDLSAIQQDTAPKSEHLTEIKTFNQIQNRKTFIAVGTVIILIIAALFLVTRITGDKESGVSMLERKMIAVLPFVNLGPPEEEYFADGITEEITSRLACLHELGVISRTSALKYKNSDKTLKQIGKELEVDFILEGTIRWEQQSVTTGRVRITPQLIRISDDTHIWTEQYDRTIDRIFDVQSEMAEQVAKQLDLKLLEPERRALNARPTENLDAYDYFLRGFNHQTLGLAADRKEELERSIEMYQKAVELDPDFAVAYAWLSQGHSWLYFSGIDRTKERLAQSKAAIDEALRISPELPIAHNMLALYYYRGFLDYDRALKEFEYIKKIRPNFSPEVVGYIQRRQGKWEESIKSLNEAYKLNPRDAMLIQQQGLTFLVMRKYQDALLWFERSFAINPNFYSSIEFKALTTILWKGDIKEAQQIAGKLPQTLEFENIRLNLNRVERNYNKMLSQINSLPSDIFELQYSLFQKNFGFAAVYHLMQKPSLVQIHADTARMIFEKQVQNYPDDPRHRMSLGLAYAYLGRKTDAVREGQRAVEICPVSKDALAGYFYLQELTRIYILAGEYEEAINQLQYLLSIPSEISVAILKIDPIWDPLREHPKFQNLLNK